MRRTRVNVPSCGEVQKTKYGRPRGSDSVQAAGNVGSRGTSSTLTRLQEGAAAMTTPVALPVSSRRAYYVKHRDRLTSLARAHYAAHRAERQVSLAIYHAAHQDKIKVSKAIYYTKNQVRIRAAAKARYASRKLVAAPSPR